MTVIEKELSPTINRSIIPDDQSTLFICSGMQVFKHKFNQPDMTRCSTIQSCVRMNDFELVGDGTHLTSFQMIGNFSFGNNDYQNSVEMWKSIVSQLHIPIHEVHVHPDSDLRKWWSGFNIVDDPECIWSDGEIGGFCCEMYSHGLEIGNLVNPLNHSTDVGFGLERMLQIMEGKSRVDESTLFDQRLDPVTRDHYRTLMLMKENGIKPGAKGRDYICRKLIRRLGKCDLPGLEEWFEEEKRLKMKRMEIARAQFIKPRNQGKPFEWWREALGLTVEEFEEIKCQKL